MKITAIHIGMKIRHPQYGEGKVTSISEHTVDVQFEDGKRIIDPEASAVEPAEAHVSVSGLDTSLQSFIEQIVSASVRELGLEKSDFSVDKLGSRWHGGKLVMQPADAALQAKEIPLEVFFHKIVMMRNNFRVMEQKINGNEKLTDGEKVELQQYITRCYGSLTSFNILFKSKDDHFSGSGS